VAAPAIVLDLVERFHRNRDDYRSGRYNEAQVRREFIDPFFKALGWDVDNERGYAEPYKDVIHEDAIKVGGFTKAPDYCFRIGGSRKFFLEAKKPSVSLKEDVSPAYQLRRYAWSAKLPLSVLTDFEEFAVYDCRGKPISGDKPSTARTIYLTYDQYPQRWQEIEDILSREAVLRGSFDRYVESNRAKRGTAEVDDAFLEEISAWREELARNLALRNPTLSPRELNYAVQQTIDRLIFLRIAEDRGLEVYGRLLALVNGGQVYERLCDLYRQADERYNSGLFHFREEKGRAEPPDELSYRLKIDDRVLAGILKNLYYPESPYEFSVLPVDILGQVYEQFLGKVIRLTPGHQAKVEEKPEVKKAGGVYYTPTYIVDYIVEHTVGALCQGKTPAQVAKLRIVDPACGSGSFLLGAYEYLLDWHLSWYRANDPERWARRKDPPIYQAGRNLTPPAPFPRRGKGEAGDVTGQTRGSAPTGTVVVGADAPVRPVSPPVRPSDAWELTIAERKRILLDCIYGVDIDAQAVEVTKLSLLLKVLEGETAASAATQLAFLRQRALPDLGNNVKCGNSLIGPDYWDGRQTSMFNGEEERRVNAFDWQRQFPTVFAAGGFDAVIGNPPYIRIQTLKEWAPQEVEFYKQRYASASKGNYDIYVAFAERGLSLLNQGGRLGFILPHKFFNAQYGRPLRSLLAQGNHVAEVVHFGDQQVFANATTYTCLLFLDKAGAEQVRFTRVTDLAAWRNDGKAESGDIPAAKLGAAEWNLNVGRVAGLFDRLSAMPVKLGDVADIFVGLQTSADPVYLFKNGERTSEAVIRVQSEALEKAVELEPALLKPVVRSGSIGRYRATPTALVLFPYVTANGRQALLSEADLRRSFPLAWKYLTANRALLTNREHSKFAGAGWYQLYPKNLDLWERPKIMLPYMITRLAAHYDECGNYFVNVTTGGFGLRAPRLGSSLKYLTGLLNSRALDWFLKRVSTSFHGGYLAANKQFLVQLPIRTIDFDDPADVARHERMVALVERMLELHKQLAVAKVPSEKELLGRQIEATDRQIDRLVYELYGLTDEEIAVVEGSS